MASQRRELHGRRRGLTAHRRWPLRAERARKRACNRRWQTVSADRFEWAMAEAAARTSKGDGSRVETPDDSVHTHMASTELT